MRYLIGTTGETTEDKRSRVGKRAVSKISQDWITGAAEQEKASSVKRSKRG